VPRRRRPFGVAGDDVRHLDDAVEVSAGRLNVASGGRRAHTTATFTQWIGGSASNRHSHCSPPLPDDIPPPFRAALRDRDPVCCWTNPLAPVKIRTAVTGRSKVEFSRTVFLCLPLLSGGRP
jgi:hypothetical protein